MRHLWTVTSQKAITDAETGEVSLISVLNGIGFSVSQIPTEPVALPFPVHVTSAWWRSDVSQAETGEMQLIYRSPSGEELTTINQPVDLSEQDIVYSAGRFDGVPYVGDGWYTFEIKQRSSQQDKWESVALLPLRIDLTKEENLPSPSTNGS